MPIPQNLLDNDELIQNINFLKESKIVKDFHKLYYETRGTWTLNKYREIPVLKYPTDLWLYQELITRVRPNLIIETGTAFGGSALYFSDLQIINKIKPAKVITVDIENYPDKPKNKNIKYINDSSLSSKVVSYIKKEVKKYKKVMVVLDSSHASDHVYNELNIYSDFVTKHSYLVVEDQNLGNEVMTHVKDTLGREVGPAPATKKFLEENDDFVADVLCERQLLSTNIGGYLFKTGE